MDVTGACHCGEISFEARIDPQLAVICNCTDCQTFSGAPFRTVVPVMADDLRLTGSPRLYVKVAQSGRRRAQAFCGTCGASIYSADAESPTRYNIRVGALAQRDQIPAQAQLWRESAVEWAQDVSKLPAAPQDDFVEPR